MAQTEGEIYHVLGLEESMLWKWLYNPKQSTDSIKLLMVLSTELEQKIAQFVWINKKPWRAEAILR